MKIVQTLWTKPGLTGGWLNSAYHFMSWSLSCLQLRKYYDEVELYTDRLGKSILIDALKLPYTKVHVELDQLNYPDYYWALPKIYVYGRQEAPFLHVDGDIFIWDKFFGSQIDHDVMYQDMEFENINDSFYSITIDQVKVAAGNSALPDWITYYEHGKVQALNAGVFGGRNIDFFKEHARLAFDFVEQYKTVFSTMKFPQSVNHLFEQVLSRVLLDKKGLSHKSILPGIQPDSVPEGPQYDMFDHYGISPLGCKYMHLLGHLKVDPQICRMLANRLSISYAQYYERVIQQYRADLLPAEKDNGKWAHSIFMPGVIRRQPETTGTMRQMAMELTSKSVFSRTAILLEKLTKANLPARTTTEFIKWFPSQLPLFSDLRIRERINDVFEFELERYRYMCSIETDDAMYIREQKNIRRNELLYSPDQPDLDELIFGFNNDYTIIYSKWDWTKKYNFDTLAVNFRIRESEVQTVISADTLFRQITEYNITRLCQAILYVFYEPKTYREGLHDLEEFIEGPLDPQTNEHIFRALTYLVVNNILTVKKSCIAASIAAATALATKPSK